MWIIKQHQEKSLCHHSERRKHLTNIHCVSCRKIVRHKYVKNEVDTQQAPKRQSQNWNLLRYRDRKSLYILRSSPSQQQWGVQKYNGCAGECCWERKIQVYVNFGCILVQRTSQVQENQLPLLCQYERPICSSIEVSPVPEFLGSGAWEIAVHAKESPARNLAHGLCEPSHHVHWHTKIHPAVHVSQSIHQASELL